MEPMPLLWEQEPWSLGRQGSPGVYIHVYLCWASPPYVSSSACTSPAPDPESAISLNYIIKVKCCAFDFLKMMPMYACLALHYQKILGIHKSKTKKLQWKILLMAYFPLSSLDRKIDLNVGWILLIENRCIIILIFQAPMLGMLLQVLLWVTRPVIN